MQTNYDSIVIFSLLFTPSLFHKCHRIYMHISEVLAAQNVTIDYITMCIAIWNFGWVGLVAIHWKGPLLLQQVCMYAYIYMYIYVYVI